MPPVRNALVAALLLLASGCGDPKTPTEPDGGPQEHLVTVSDFQFTPARMEIHPGDTVTWRNAGGFHNVVADDGSFRCAESCAGAGGDPSTVLWSFTRTFATAGSVPYYCEVHGGSGGRGMSGEIVVVAP